KVKKKGEPPALPAWAKMPQKTLNVPRIDSKVKTLSLALDEGLRVKIKPPYTIYQIAPLKDTAAGVMMPVRVEKKDFWFNGTLDMFQVSVKLGGGANIYDTPKGVVVGFVSSPIEVMIKKINGEWAYISHEMHAKCSPVYLKGWVHKKFLLGNMKSNVAFPWRFTKKLPTRQLNTDAPLFEVYARSRGGDFVLQLPMCDDNSQVILVNKVVRSAKGRTRVFFKPTKTAPFAILGYMRADIAQGATKGSCTCKTTMPQTNTYGTSVIERDYTIRTDLPLYLTPDETQKPVGVIHKVGVQKVSQYYKNGKFAVIEIEYGLTLYAPYHADYFFP
ncbi:hypothetical protein KJ865_10080, partial [Myxococcota bacterium]|nr:hypothetical protein [Myxococcota bacterium]